MNNSDAHRIYSQHDAAFAQVSAYVILKGADRVATVAMKFPRDGAGRLYAYLHVIGAPMVRGFASGGGYDKRSAAVESAAEKLTDLAELPIATQENLISLRETLQDTGGFGWVTKAEQAGFTVLQAV